jgi:transcriptional regulator with XRE-family HTH domain
MSVKSQKMLREIRQARGRRLAEARNKRGLTQEALARRIKSRKTSGTLSPSAISLFERGRTSFSETIAKRVAKAVRVDVNWLMKEAA